MKFEILEDEEVEEAGDDVEEAEDAPDDCVAVGFDDVEDEDDVELDPLLLVDVVVGVVVVAFVDDSVVVEDGVIVDERAKYAPAPAMTRTTTIMTTTNIRPTAVREVTSCISLLLSYFW